MIVIGITGKINSGKGTAAQIFEDLGLINFGFSDPLKLAIHNLFDVDENILWGSSDKRNEEVRIMLQDLGVYTQKHRPKAIVELMRRRLTVFDNSGVDSLHCIANSLSKGVVISDIRYSEEAQLIKEVGGKLIKIIGSVNSVPKNNNIRNHITETAVDDISPTLIDYTVKNSSTLVFFKKQIMAAAQEIMK